MADEVGSLEAGKRADMVIRSNELPDAQPNVNVVKQLMLVSRDQGVDTVLCNGEVVVRHGAPNLDEKRGLCAGPSRRPKRIGRSALASVESRLAGS